MTSPTPRRLRLAAAALTTLTVLAATTASPTALAGDISAALQSVLDGYRTDDASTFDVERGQALFAVQRPDPDGGAARSCQTCHTADLGAGGKHVKTAEPIAPLSPSVTVDRLTDAAEIEKWLGRNCKWTYGRPCSSQEKGDLLVYINH